MSEARGTYEGLDGEGVDLVGHDVHVVLSAELEDELHLVAGVAGAHGVGGVGEDEQLGDVALVDGALVGLGEGRLGDGVARDGRRERGRTRRRWYRRSRSRPPIWWSGTWGSSCSRGR